jgi:signal transduction histidine kinase
MTGALASPLHGISTSLSLRAVFYGAAALLMLAGALTLGAALTGMSNAGLFLAEASRSYEQLALVTRLEADIRSLLLDAWQIEPPAGRGALPLIATRADVEEVEHVFSSYLDSIRRELDQRRSRESAGSHPSELDEAVALRALFRDILDEGHDGGVREDSAAGASAAGEKRHQRVAELRQRVRDIVEGERREVDETIGAMAEARRRFMRWAGLLAAGASAGMLAMLAYLHAAMIAPLTALSERTLAFGEGNLEARISPVGAREVVELGRRFNRMADRISSQHEQLLASNATLEASVRERTRDLEVKSAQLAEIDRSRRLFFAKVGHELRTPVTVLRGEAEVALRNKAADVSTLRDALHHIVAGGDVLQRRLEDLLTLARSEDGRLVLRRQSFDLASCASQATDQAVAFAASSGVRLVFGGPERPLMIDGDESWVRQALLSIIDNAIKFSPVGAAVTVMLPADARLPAIEISDEGPGVPHDSVDRLFEPYFKGAGSAGRAGFGLGLAVARWVAEQHGGTIAATNRPQGGLSIVLTFPGGEGDKA